jgi:hypothetical protein
VFEDDALGLARRLFAQFDEAIDALSLIPVGEPEFDLFLDGRSIHIVGPVARRAWQASPTCDLTADSKAVAPPLHVRFQRRRPLTQVRLGPAEHEVSDYRIEQVVCGERGQV